MFKFSPKLNQTMAVADEEADVEVICNGFRR